MVELGLSRLDQHKTEINIKTFIFQIVAYLNRLQALLDEATNNAKYYASLHETEYWAIQTQWELRVSQLTEKIADIKFQNNVG